MIYSRLVFKILYYNKIAVLSMCVDIKLNAKQPNRDRRNTNGENESETEMCALTSDFEWPTLCEVAITLKLLGGMCAERCWLGESAHQCPSILIHIYINGILFSGFRGANATSQTEGILSRLYTR